MNYKDKFYSKYVSVHTSRLYGEIFLGDIKRQFPVWQKYFGRFLPEDKKAKIIDLGCGNGGFIYWLQQIGYQNAEGIDISAEQIEAGQKLGIKNIRQADIKEFLITQLPNNYDVIFMRDILEHFNKEEVIDILDFIYASLKQNGRFICQTVNAENLLWGRLRHGDFTHELAFTEDSIRQILRLIGFQNISVYAQRPVIHGLKSLIRAVLWKYIELEIKFYLLIETGSAKGIFTQNLIAVAYKTENRNWLGESRK